MTAWRFLFFSLILHLLVWLLMVKHAEYIKAQKDNAPIEVAIVDKSKNDQAQRNQQPRYMAPSLKTPPMKKLEPLPPKYFSEADQYVEKQTHAQNLQLYNPISPATTGSAADDSKDKKTSSQDKSEKISEKSEQNDSTDGDTAFKKEQAGGKKSASTAASDPLFYEDAEVGSITALNAQGMQFYAFTSRIQGPIVNHWTRNIRYVESRYTNHDLERIAGHDWVTVVEAVLDNEGHHKETYILQSSGERDLDDAATTIFKQIAYFPNPPREMAGEDGKIHLKLAFRVHAPPLRQMATTPQF